MGSSSEIINIEAKAQRIAVDNRISLRFYFRIANNVLKQAAIFRAENNLIDLYVMLLRFSSLGLETIPSHRDYGKSSKYDKEYLRMRSLDVLTELEKLKPAVQRILIELKAKHTRQAFQSHQHGTDLSVRHGIRKPMVTNYNTPKVTKPAGLELGYQSSRSQKFLHAGPVEDQFRNLSANFVRPSVETLSKHSFLGPNGLNGQWQPPKIDRKVYIVDKKKEKYILGLFVWASDVWRPERPASIECYFECLAFNIFSFQRMAPADTLLDSQTNKPINSISSLVH